MRDQYELALRCLEVEQAGGDVYEYLKVQGFISPRATWQRLQMNELNRTKVEVETGEIKMQKITLEQKKKAVQIAIDGGDPKKYLAQCGSGSPDKLWGYIKKVLKEKDPALYEQIPDFRHTAKQKPAVDETPVVKISGPIKIETPEANQVDVVETPEGCSGLFKGTKGEKAAKARKITAPLQYGDFTVRAVEGDFGSYHFSDINGKQWIDYDDKEMANQLSMTVEQWRGFILELQNAAKVLGVELP